MQLQYADSLFTSLNICCLQYIYVCILRGKITFTVREIGVSLGIMRAQFRAPLIPLNMIVAVVVSSQKGSSIGPHDAE